jgi:nitrogen fixation NifU-like protein
MDDDLYHRAILELARESRVPARLAAPEVSVTLDNPLCGDRVTLDLALADGRLAALGHHVRGCLLCQAAATVIARHAPGETVDALRAVVAQVERAVREAPATAGGLWPEIQAFDPVHRHRSRHDCVLLPFAALRQGLDRLVGR